MAFITLSGRTLIKLMRGRVASAKPATRSKSRPQSAYEVHKPRLLEGRPESGFRLASSKPNRVKAKHDPSVVFAKQTYTVERPSDSQPFWIREAIGMVKNGQKNRSKVG